MFDGKTFFPVTGMPIRKIACIRRLFALAEPVPFTVPIRKAKSFLLPCPERSEGSVVGCGTAAPALGGFMLWPPFVECERSVPDFQSRRCPLLLVRHME